MRRKHTVPLSINDANCPPVPIDQLKEEFLKQLRTTHIVVEADTGSGKSTRLPIWAAMCDDTKKVIVVEPRRIACIALASYVAQLSGANPGAKLGKAVGYAVRFDQQYEADTRILFVTPGIALRWLADKQLHSYHTVIIDEFHERRWDTDLLLALLKQQDTHRIVLTSATIRGEQLARYVEGERLFSKGKLFPVSVNHLAENPQQMPHTMSLDTRVRSACEQSIRQLQDNQKNDDILVFLPGRKEIQSAFQQLKGIDAIVICLSASSTKQEQQLALNQQSQRRIILSTNVAETSLTIPNIGVVIDSGLERRTHQRNGRTVLGLDPISNASAEQRKGRAGRLSEGHCIRLWGEYAPLLTITPPEVLREELTELVLAASCNNTPVQALNFPDPLPEKSLTVANNKLLAMGAINISGIATEHGKRLYPLPIDTQFSHLISSMPDIDCKMAMVDLVAALSTQQKLITFPKSEQGRQTLSQWVSLDCDVSTLIQIVRRQPPQDIVINTTARKEARTLAQQIRSSLKLPMLEKDSSIKHFDRQKLLDAVIQAAPELVFVRRAKRRQALGNGFSEVIVGDNSRLQESVEAALVFDQHSLPGKGIRQTLSVATCLAPLHYNDIIRANICTEKMGHVHWKQEQLIVTTNLLYAGREIGQRQANPKGLQARQAITQLIFENRLFPNLGQKIQDDINAYTLYQALQQNKNTSEILPAEQWLLEKLQRLGVESSEDLVLIEPSDICFDGIPDWEKEQFMQDFPQHLFLSDLALEVHYTIAGKTVTVERVSGTRKTDPKRWELPSWKGWRIRYKKASRIIDIR